MKTLKITLTPEQCIQLAHAATLEIDLPDYDQLANELQSAKTTLEAITALLNPNGHTGLSLPELLQQRLAEAACEGFKFGVESWFAESHTVVDVENWKCNKSEEFASRRYLPNKKAAK